MTPQGKARLVLDEGTQLKVYDDETGFPVVKLPSGGNPTIGIGRNLSGRGITYTEALYLFSNDIATIEAKLNATYNWLASIPPVWFDVLVMIEFNTGNIASWPNLLAAMRNGDTNKAHTELMNSSAARQLPSRYARMGNALLYRVWASDQAGAATA